MTPSRWRYIPLLTDSGPFHMAADTHLAEQAPELPVLRLYRWDPHAISLGYHQNADVVDRTIWKSQPHLDLVRRPTGGRAILHADELTYAVVLPRKSGTGTGSVHDIHNRISFAIAGGLRSLGYEVKLNARQPNLRQHYSDDTDAAACFSAAAKYELQIDGKKVVGSAQRKFQSAVLQHGSILLGPEHRDLINYMNYTPEQKQEIAGQFEKKTTELSQHTGESIDLNTLCQVIREGFAVSFHCSFLEKPFTENELQSIRHQQKKYRILDHHASEEDNSRE